MKSIWKESVYILVNGVRVEKQVVIVSTRGIDVDKVWQADVDMKQCALN